jgi:hypothetical protein
MTAQSHRSRTVVMTAQSHRSRTHHFRRIPQTHFCTFIISIRDQKIHRTKIGRLTCHPDIGAPLHTDKEAEVGIREWLRMLQPIVCRDRHVI